MSVGLLSTLYKDYGKNEEWLNISMLIGSIGEIIFYSSFDIFKFLFKIWNGNTAVFKHRLFDSILLFYVLLFIEFTDVLFWWFPKIKVILMHKMTKKEQDIRLYVALFFSIISVMLWLKMEIAFGAFVAGIFIATFLITKKISLKSYLALDMAFLVPVFFIHLGSTFKLESLLSVDIA